MTITKLNKERMTVMKWWNDNNWRTHKEDEWMKWNELI